MAHFSNSGPRKSSDAGTLAWTYIFFLILSLRYHDNKFSFSAASVMNQEPPAPLVLPSKVAYAVPYYNVNDFYVRLKCYISGLSFCIKRLIYNAQTSNETVAAHVMSLVSQSLVVHAWHHDFIQRNEMQVTKVNHR